MKLWDVKKPACQLQEILARELNISPIIAQLLINRGITSVSSAQEFLKSDLNALHDPFLLKDMDKAVLRIKEAIGKNEKVLIYGDYDVDGITGVTLLYLVLKGLGADVHYYIPHRVEEGYGLNKEAIYNAYKTGVNLLISTDCGITSFEEVDYLNELRIDTIITDHHKPKDSLIPNAFAVINPLRRDCPYPYKYLAGVGVAFKLAHGLCGELSGLLQYMDLVSIGTVADIVPVTGENRAIVKYGLSSLSNTQRLGLKALIEVSGLKGRAITATHVGFIIGPRINAAGRIGSPETAVNLLLAGEYERALQLANILDEGNRARQRLEEKTLKEALWKIEQEINFKEDRVIVLNDASWHQGVTGIVASRIVERFYRPTILVVMKDGIGRGSGRSIRNFPLLDALSQCEKFLEKYGGHEYAAGLVVLKENLMGFKDALNGIAHNTLQDKDLIPRIGIDMEIPLGEISEGLIDQIEKLAPFGVGNPKPVFSSKGVSVKTIPRVMGRNTVKMWVTDGKVTCEAVGFNMASGELRLPEKDEKISLVYSLSINDWQGTSTLQLKMIDLKPSEPCQP